MPVGVYNVVGNFTRNYNHIGTLGGTLTLAAFSVDNLGKADGSDTFTFSSDNVAVATVNSSTGVVTAVANGVCNVLATSANGHGGGIFPLGVALLTLGASSINFGSSTTASVSGGGSTKWTAGTGVTALIGPNDTGLVTGSSVTIITVNCGAPPNTTPPPATGTAHSPIDAIVQTGQTTVSNLAFGTGAGGGIVGTAIFGGIYCSKTLTVTNTPFWTGN